MSKIPTTAALMPYSAAENEDDDEANSKKEGLQGLTEKKVERSQESPLQLLPIRN